MTGKFRMEAVEMNGPVTVHDVAVYPGDLVLADESGVCFVPPGTRWICTGAVAFGCEGRGSHARPDRCGPTT